MGFNKELLPFNLHANSTDPREVLVHLKKQYFLQKSKMRICSDCSLDYYRPFYKEYYMMSDWISIIKFLLRVAQ